MTSSVLAAFLLLLVVSSMEVELPYFCSFEDPELCGMEHREGGDFDWTRHTESTLSDGTGPDRAAESLWYMYIETSHGEPDNREQGDKAYIQTPAIEYTGDLCIRFQYHMNGAHIGRLVVFVDTRGENSVTAFAASGNQNNTWHSGAANVKGFKTGDRVVFMAERGNGHLGDIAIDNLHIAKETCNECQINNGGCDHICRRQGNWEICSCHDGYIKDGQRCILSTKSTTSRTSTPSPTSTPSTTSIPSRTRTPATMSTSSATNRPDTPVLTRTTSPVERTITTTQPESRTTARATRQQTEETTGLAQNVTYSLGDSHSNADRRIAYIVGGVLAGVVLVVGVVLLVICIIRRRRNGAGEDGSTQPNPSFLLPLHFPKRGRKEQVSLHGDDSEPVVTQREPKLSARLSRLSLTLTRILTAPKPTDASGQHDMEAANVTAPEPPPELLRKIPGEDFPSYVTGQKSKGALAQEFKARPPKA